MSHRSLVLCLFLFVIARHASASMSSANFQIGWDDVNGGGNDYGTSTNFQIQDTVGDQGAGRGTSINYKLSSGYRFSDNMAVLSLIFRGQDDTTQTEYTSFNDAGKSVTVISSAPFSVTDHIAVVENQGFSQKVAVGKIVSIVGQVLTVDEWDGNNPTINPVPDANGDFVYALTNSKAAFGNIMTGYENTVVAVTSVQSTGLLGYTVYRQANQALQDGGGVHEMGEVMDGAVSLGSEEYGVMGIGTFAINGGVDLAVSTTQIPIQESLAPSGGFPDRIAQVYKLSVTNATETGVYGHTVMYTLTANY